MREVGKLTTREIATKRKQGRYADGAGLYLQVGPSGNKSWLFRYTRFGQHHYVGLGALHTVGLKDARERARQMRVMLLDEKDPLTEKRALRANRAETITFRQCAEQFLIQSPVARKWSNAEHCRQWRVSLQTYVYPKLGHLPVNEIGVADVKATLLPIWQRIPETASRVRGRIERILDWATTSEHRSGENPASWRRFKDILGEVPDQKHFDALPYDDLPQFMLDLGGNDSTAPALRFLILTASRTEMVLGADWSEVDLEQKTWTVPASRMKSRKEHIVPLSDAAIAALGAKGEGRIFTVDRKSLLRLVKKLRPDATVHGFRSTFRTWAAERTNYPNEVCEQCLAHSISGRVEKAYKRTTLFDQRRRLMDTWAQFATSPVVAGKVVALHG